MMAPSYQIAVVGSHGVGKTTLAVDLAESLGVDFIPETSRAVAKIRGIASLEEPDAYTVGVDFQFQCLAHQIGAERGSRSFVVDRGLLDYLAYPLALGVFQDRMADLQVYMDLIDRHLDYTHVIYVPISSDVIEPDGFRSTDQGFQRAIDRLIRRLYRAEDPKVSIDLSRVSSARWLDHCLEVIRPKPVEVKG